MNPPYVIYLNWHEFSSALPDRGTVQVQVVSTTTTSQMVPLVTTALWLTACAAEQVQALRLPIETADLLLPTDEAKRARRRVLHQHADLAKLCAVVSLPKGVAIAPGLLLVPGLYDDLVRIEGSSTLWHWMGDQRTPETRQLVPAPNLQGAVAQYQRERKDLFDDDDDEE